MKIFQCSIYLVFLTLGHLSYFPWVSDAYQFFCRKLFESTVSNEFLTVDNLIWFVRSRISILENAGETSKSISKPIKFNNAFGNKFKLGKVSPISLIVDKPSKASVPCLCCEGTHTLDSYPQFGLWSVFDRT